MENELSQSKNEIIILSNKDMAYNKEIDLLKLKITENNTRFDEIKTLNINMENQIL